MPPATPSKCPSTGAILHPRHPPAETTDSETQEGSRSAQPFSLTAHFSPLTSQFSLLTSHFSLLTSHFSPHLSPLTSRLSLFTSSAIGTGHARSWPSDWTQERKWLLNKKNETKPKTAFLTQPGPIRPPKIENEPIAGRSCAPPSRPSLPGHWRGRTCPICRRSWSGRQCGTERVPQTGRI
jgi:hypothetical protein